MKLSIIIVNYNVRYFLEQCLHSVYAACQDIDAEIFVVDNASADSSVKMVREKFPGATCITNPDNKGFAKANNQAVKVSHGKYILLLNPDTIVEKNTLSKTLAFMDLHPEAGALGVKMLDGKGRFLPESKRGLPTPAVAFYKLSGLSGIFPKSRVFNRYSLGFLSEDETHEVDIVAGAFMLLRKEALTKTGLLDEDFFMYGEDIDLSYRLLKSGYRNYYFPETRIIHFKGQSTRKESLSNHSAFYKAMLIFVRKHFAPQRTRMLIAFLSVAIMMSASVSLVKKTALRLAFPLLDALLTFAGFYLSARIWETWVIYPDGGHFPRLFYELMIPAFCLMIIISILLSTGYNKYLSYRKVYAGIAIGSIVNLTAYSLLPENFRFSRAVIILGILCAFISLPSYRYLLSLGRFTWFPVQNKKNKRFLIVAKPDEAERVTAILKNTFSKDVKVKYISVDNYRDDSGLYAGELADIREIISVQQADEIIFSARDVSASQMINTMLSLKGSRVSFKIAPAESSSIIGSDSTNSRGEIYAINLHR